VYLELIRTGTDRKIRNRMMFGRLLALPSEGVTRWSGSFE